MYILWMTVCTIEGREAFFKKKKATLARRAKAVFEKYRKDYTR